MPGDQIPPVSPRVSFSSYSSRLPPGQGTVGIISASKIKPQGFTILNPGEDPLVADVVFIHGLGGDPELSWAKKTAGSLSGEKSSSPGRSSWKRLLRRSISSKIVVGQEDDPRDQLFWPRDLLPQTVKDVRILTYGYDSKVIRLFQTSSNNGIVQHAGNLLASLVRIRAGLDPKTRPLIFIAHSFGGILVKEVLRQSQANEFQEEKLLIARYTYGVIFLGCPHRGSTSAEWGKILSNIAIFAMQSPNKDVIRSLSKYSEMLQITSDAFSVLLKRGGLQVHSFYEERGMSGIPGFTDKVVEDGSAIIGDAAERKEGINADHRQMVKFGGLDDDGYVKVAGAIKRYVDNIRSQQAANAKSREALKINLSGDELECRRLFYISDYTTKLSSIPKHEPGTCKWVITHPRFEEWRYNPQQTMLWLSGNPGCGKSVMSCFLISHFQTDLNQAVVYFLCDNKDETLKTDQVVLRSILHQLFSLKPVLIRYAMPSYKQMRENMFHSTGTMWKILRAATRDREFGSVFCIIDGLDECDSESQKSLLRNLSQLFPPPTQTIRGNNLTGAGGFKVLVTSRPWPYIERGFYGVPHIRLRSEEESAINVDVEIYVNNKVEHLAYIGGYPENVKKKVYDTLMSKANGMFLWVALVMEQLESSPSDSIEECLSELPNDLYGLYEQIMKNVGSNERAFRRIKEILLWVVTTLRPLTVEELAFACAVEEDKGIHIAALDIEGRSAKIGNDVCLCEPILSIRNGIVSLVHQSAKDFFLRHRTPLSQQFYPDVSSANFTIAELCITYLSHFSFSVGALNMRRLVRNEAIFQERLATHPLLEYSATFWLQHMQRATDSQTMSGTFLSRFFTFADPHLKYFNSWAQTWWFLRETYTGFPLGLTPLHFLSYFAESSVARTLLDHKSSSPNAPDLSGQTPIHWACKAGCDDAVRLLLGKNVKSNQKDSMGRTPLHLACSSGSSSVLTCLLRQGHKLNVNDRDGTGRTPLHYAAAAGATEVVEVLLGEGADGGAMQPKSGRYVLHEAAWRGADDIVQMLLEHGAKVDSCDRAGWTALHWAAEVDSCSTIEVLLANGADVMATSKNGSTALYQAAFGDSEGTARLLLERGADVQIMRSDGRTPLHAAAWKGSEATTRLLLDWGAHVNTKDCSDRIALHDAAWRGSEEVFKLLLERGANIAAVSNTGRTVMHEAAWRGSHDIISLLLASGLGMEDITAKDSGGRTILHEAAWRGSEETINLLLEEGINAEYINAYSDSGRTALHEAARSNSVTAVRILLSCGSDVMKKDHDGRTALYWGAEGGVENVRLLLDTGIPISLVDHGGRTALHWACQKGTDATVQLLVEKGIKVSLADKNGRTALHEAALRGATTKAALLIDGTDLAAQDHEGRTVLHDAVKGGSDVLIRLLLEHGADRGLRDCNGCTPIDLVKSNGIRAVFKESEYVVV